MTEYNLSKLQKLATESANQHGWYVIWDRVELQSIMEKRGEVRMSIGEALALCHSELSEALEAYRDDDKDCFAEEIADTLIRLLHISGDLNINLSEEVNKKMQINKLRPNKHGRKNF